MVSISTIILSDGGENNSLKIYLNAWILLKLFDKRKDEF